MVDFFSNSFSTFLNFQQNHHFCDFILKSYDSTTEFYVHRLVLAAQSEFFQTLFQTKMKERETGYVCLESIRMNILDKIIRYCYTGNIDITPSDIEEILDASNMLNIPNIVQKCFDFLQNNMNVFDWLRIMELAEKYNNKQMTSHIREYLQSNFRSIVTSEDFLCINYDNLLQLISQDNLNVYEESDVYEAVLKWVKYDVIERKRLLKDLLRFVRFPLLTRKFLIDVVTKEDLILSDSDCREYLYKALDYHLIPERRCNTTTITKDLCPRISLPKQIFVFGGENRTGVLNTVEVFDLSSNTWSHHTHIKTPIKHPAVIMLNASMYIIGGIDHHGNDLNNVLRYDPVNNLWNSAAPMEHCKGALGVCVLDGWIYAMGGSNALSSLNNVERYDPGHDRWHTVQSMKVSRSHFNIGVRKNIIYAIGGRNGHSPTQHCEKYDVMVNSWTEIAFLNKPRMDHGVVVYGEKLFAVGGVSNNGILDCIEKYNHGLQLWLIIKHTLDPRTGACISLVESDDCRKCRLFMIGGIDESHCFHSSTKEVNLKSVDYSVTNGKAMLEPRAHAGVIVL